MYTIGDYGRMIADEPRMQAYTAALRRVVGPNTSVLDLGSGPGIMAFLACRLGARKVIAVEPDYIVQLAQQIAAASGFGTRIEFLQGLSTSVEPPHRCDVVVSDLHGVLPLLRQNIRTFVDVRQRWLAEGGLLIPREESIFAAVIESQRVWDTHLRGWTADVGADLSPVLQVLSGCARRVELTPEALLTEATRWASIDYRTVASENYEALLSWHALREGTAHGIALWFDSVLTDGVTMSNCPGEPPMIYGQMYLPWPQPVVLRSGDCIEARVRASLVGDDYVWAWDTDVYPAGPGGVRRTFRQSTLQANVWTSEQLASQQLDARRTLTAKGRAVLETLMAMDRRATSREIGLDLMERFPCEFPQLQQAASFVSRLQSTYAQ